MLSQLTKILLEWWGVTSCEGMLVVDVSTVHGRLPSVSDETVVVFSTTLQSSVTFHLHHASYSILFPTYCYLICCLSSVLHQCFYHKVTWSKETG